MNAWEVFWTIVLLAGIIMFAGLAIVVGIGGFFDVREMFRHIDQEHAATHENN